MSTDFSAPMAGVSPDSGRPVRPVRPTLTPVGPGVPERPRRPQVLLPAAGTQMPDVATGSGSPEPEEKKAKKGKKKSGSPFRMTDRDVKILGFLGRYRLATVGQLARAFETSETALRNRLPRLEEQGLVTWAWVTQNKPKVWLVTAAGLAVAEMDLTEPTIKWGQFRHNLGLVDLGIGFEAAGEVVLTEREIRAAAGKYEPSARMKKALDLTRLQSNLPEMPLDGLTSEVAGERVRRGFIIAMPGRSLGHVPDMVLIRQPYASGASGSIAVELELTRKGLGEWRQILTAYRNSDTFDKVHYFAGNKEIARSLNGVIHGIGADEKISVSVFAPVDLTGDPLTTGSRSE